MTLDKFETELAQIIGRPTELRPFVCEGSPLDCEIMFVGFNPRTEMSGDFWRFWKPGYGFDKTSWDDDYLCQRRAAGDSDTSRSREVMALVGKGRRVLEANIFPKASKDEQSLSRMDRDPGAFRYLLEAVNPKVIVAYGRFASKEVDRHPTYCPVVKVKHFSRGWSDLRAIDQGRRLGALINLETKERM